MKIIEDVRRLAGLNLTDRAIARALKIDRRSVNKYRASPNFNVEQGPQMQAPEWHVPTALILSTVLPGK